MLTLSDYPKNKEGRPLFFLTQINLSECPAIEGFPTTGMLQFFISDTHNYGIDWDAPLNNDNYRVNYYDEKALASKNVISDFSFLPDF